MLLLYQKGLMSPLNNEKASALKQLA